VVSGGHPSVVYTWVSVVWVLVWAGLLMMTVVGCCRSVGRCCQPNPPADMANVPTTVLRDRARWAGPV
jgi:hypothetical protein